MDVFELDVVEISQNERYVPTRGWSSRNLFASDPRHYASACCGGDGPDAAAPLGRGESWITFEIAICIGVTSCMVLLLIGGAVAFLYPQIRATIAQHRASRRRDRPPAQPRAPPEPDGTGVVLSPVVPAATPGARAVL